MRALAAPPRALLSAVGAALLLAGCGDAGTGAPALAEARAQQVGAAEAEALARVLALRKVSEMRVARTVYDYVYRVQVQAGARDLSALRLSLRGAGTGVSIVDGEVELGALAAGATVLSEATITLRQDRSHAFDPQALVWDIDAQPAQATVFDPALCQPQAGAPYQQTVGISGSNVMVSSADLQASAAGCRVLARGGSAIDAAIAVQAVLGVAEPFGSGLAGGAVITYYDAASRQVRSYDGLSSAPANIGAPGTTSIYQMAVPEDLNCRANQSIGASLSAQQGNTNISGRATGVPGALRVLDLVHQQHGRLAWNALWDDAIALANHGTPMTRYMYSTLYSAGTAFDDETGDALDAGPVRAWWNNARDRWGAPRCKYKDIQARYCDPGDPSGERPLPVGTLIRNPALAATMALVRDGGADAFYDPQGPIVAAILQRFSEDRVRADGSNNCTSILPSSYNPATGTTSAAIIPARIPSLMTAADFASYRAVERKPLVAERFGLQVYTQPAPSFGGLVTLYTLGVLERKALASQAFGSPQFMYLVSEASRMSNADRRAIVGDPAYSNVNARIDALLSEAYLARSAERLNGTALASVSAAGTAEGIPPFVATDPALFDPLARLRLPPADARMLAQRAEHDEDWNTTSSLAIIDGYGNALAMTTTINTHWGAHIEAGGMMLNNAMSNFSAGAVGGDVNGYAPNKRARSSIAPSIALDSQGRVVLAWGAAGGGPIPDYIVKTFLANQVYGMDIQAAVNADNWTGQGATNSVAQFERGKPVTDLIGAMRSQYGYTSTTLGETGLTSGLAGIAVTYGADGRPSYHGAADYRRAGGANGY